MISYELINGMNITICVLIIFLAIEVVKDYKENKQQLKRFKNENN